MPVACFGRFVASLIVLAATAALTLGQPAKRTRLLPSVVLMETHYLGDRGLQAELKLTSEQIKRLEPLVQNAFGDYLFARDSAKALADRSKAQEDTRAKVLTPEQQTRLRQVILQHLGRIPAGPEILGSEDGIVKKLDLTDAQVQDLKARKQLTSTLTDKQKAVWAELCGPAYSRRLVMTGVGGSVYIQTPQAITVLRMDVIAVDLKLTDEQEDRLESLRADWLDLFPAESLNDVKKYEAGFIRSANAILTEEQRVRLEQILLQIKVYTSPHRSVYELPGVAEAIGLKAEQIQQVVAMRKERRAGLLALFLAGDTPATVREKIAAHNSETPKAITAVVPAELQARLKELLGTPLTPTNLARATSYSTDFWYLPPPPRPGSLAIFALPFGSYQQYQTLLKFDAEQIKKITALQKEMDLFPDPTKRWPEGPEDEAKSRVMAEAIEKRLAEILKPEQIKAWMQLTVRDIPFQGHLDRVPSPQLLVVHEVRSALKLTPKQLRRFERGATLGEVLDADQKQAWQELAGTPPAAKPNPEPSSTPESVQLNLFTDPVFAQLTAISDENIQKLLGFDEKQKAAIKAEQKTAQGSYGQTPYQTKAEVIQKRGAEILETVRKILDEPQCRRLQQIGIQQAMQFEGVKAVSIYSHPLIADALKLSLMQVEKLKTLVADQRELLAMIYTLPQVEQVPTGDDRYKTTIALAGVTEKRVLDVLTADQKAAFKALLGEPFRGLTRPTSRAFLPW